MFKEETVVDMGPKHQQGQSSGFPITKSCMLSQEAILPP